MENTIQDQIDQINSRLDALNASPTIPLQIDQAWQKRGFVKTTFFVAGQGTVASNGTYEQTIPGATIKSIALVTTFDGAAIGAQMIPSIGNSTFGDSTTEFNITNPSGTTFRYTYFTPHGTNPNITALRLPKGSRIAIFSSGFNSNNTNSPSNPYFFVTNSGNSFFEIDNPVGVAQSGIALGTGGITGGPTSAYSIFVEGTATNLFSFVVFLFPSLFITN